MYYFTPEIGCLTKFMMSCFAELYLIYVYLLNYVSAHPKIQSFGNSSLVTTDLFRIISTYITAEAYFGYVINYFEANRLKFGAPGWIM